MLTPPDGIDYQWGTLSVCGDESLGNISELEKWGWRKVPRSRHPSGRSKSEDWIVDGAMILMERPSYLTERAAFWESQKADAQVLRNMLSLNVDEEGNPIGLVNGRSIDLNATDKRKTTIKEFFVRKAWTVQIALRNWVSSLKKRWNSKSA